MTEPIVNPQLALFWKVAGQQCIYLFFRNTISISKAQLWIFLLQSPKNNFWNTVDSLLMELRRFTKNTLCTAIFFLLCCQPVRFLNSLFFHPGSSFSNRNPARTHFPKASPFLSQRTKRQVPTKRANPPSPTGRGAGGRSVSLSSHEEGVTVRPGTRTKS